MRVSLVVTASVGVTGENGNISPRGRMPVRIVITFFLTLETVRIVVVFLSGSGGLGILRDVLVGNVETN